MVIALIALFVALSGASYAAVSLPRNSVGPLQLKPNAVIAAKINANAVTAAKIAAKAVTAAKIAPSAVDSTKVKNGSLLSADFAADQIPPGPKGDPGTPGVSGLQLVSGTAQTGTGNHSATATCPTGKKAISGGYNTSGISGTPTITITQAAVQDGDLVYQVDGRISSGSWNLTARVVCATAS
jgi:hypothetical protein